MWGETTNKNEITRLVRSRIGLTSTTRIHFASREGKLIINGEETEAGRFTPGNIEKIVRDVVESVFGKLKKSGGARGFDRYANEGVEYLVLLSPDTLDAEVKPLRGRTPQEKIMEGGGEAAVGGRSIEPSEGTYVRAGREPTRVLAPEEVGKIKGAPTDARKPARVITRKEKVQVAVLLAVGLPLAFFAIYSLIFGVFPISPGSLFGGGGGPFAGEWRSPYACTYCMLDYPEREPYTEYTANFYLKLQQSDDEVWVEEGWMEIVSYRTVPGYSLGSDFPPLPPVPHPTQPGVYTGPGPFSGTFSRNYEYPGGYFRVTVSGNTLTFEQSDEPSNFNEVTVFTLTQGDPEFDSRDTLRVTQMSVGGAAEPNTIVLVKQ